VPSLPIVTDGYRLAHEYHSADATFVNVFWLLSPDASSEADLANAFFDAWAHVSGSFSMKSLQSSDITYDGATVTKLDGTSPSVFVAYGSTTHGSAGSGMAAAQAALVITWVTGERGRNHRGRSYIAGVPNASLETGSARWSSALIADAVDAVQGFLDGANGGSPSFTPLVVSQHSVHGSSELEITGGIPRQGLGTQRRRTERTHP